MLQPHSSVSSCEDRGGEERPRRRNVAGPAAVCPTLGKSQEEPPSRINDKMLLCLQTCCSDAEPMCWQILQLICYIVIFGASLALVVLWAYVIFPFQKPEMGFRANWVFNFVAHPVANYIVEMGMQLVMSFSVSAVEFLMGNVIQKLGNWWNVPIHIVRELGTCMKLPVIVFKASILSEAKGLWVFLSMVLPEVLQVGCSVMMVLFNLLSNNTQIQEAFATVRSRQQFVQACCISYYEFKCVQQRLKHIVQSCKTTSKKDLERMAWTWRNDHDLLNEISSSLTATVMLEVCEVMAPVIYIGLLLCLQSNTFLANNASYFVGLANANFQESLIANSFSLLLEASLLLVTELCVRAVIGMSFCSFIGSVLRCDFRFWLSTLSMAYIAWLTMVVQHTGHDLKFQFSWLP
ncbi:unnamed protein product [Cladocopium goreaui]|uniref:Uncharacterized protein n=1 Tax=Cladocopium goreaui TaxID=2562237 RepID=A0A9P1M6M1_9DINO|nr:unnamed protein product [Cladocopium goreaui]